MAELTFKSAGVSTREIDLSGPTLPGVVGVPAGVIGTALEGPAFIPLTFAKYGNYKLTYGASDGTRAGPIAVSEWLKNAQAVTYVRVLGAGDGKKRSSTTGNVTNAGFVVGNELPQDNGNIGRNLYAVDGGVPGRTYFLGSFMSASSGVNIFEEAGIQNDDRAQPILRGVLLTPSGVVPTLKVDIAGKSGSLPSSTVAAVTGGSVGFLTGAVDLAAGGSEFVILLNGHVSHEGGKNFITASFDMFSPSYFGNVLNTKAEDFEKKGHFLYGSYDIHPKLAVVTGSKILTSSLDIPETREPLAFLLSGSSARGTVTTNVPMYESFEDRFNNASSPFVISQKFGATPYNLFKIETLSDGAGVSGKFKFSIQNIVRSNSATNKYGTFDLVLRALKDSDEAPKVIESFNGVSLDPGSSRYVGRVIGDKKISYNFDTDEESQKIVVDGSHDVRSRYIRVVLSDQLKNKEVPPEALPLGFRGPRHLNTSGSALLAKPLDEAHFGIDGTGAHSLGLLSPTTGAQALHRVVEPPIPMRQSVAQGTGVSKRADVKLYWGVQTSHRVSAAQPNIAGGGYNESFNTYVKHFPTHRKDTINFSEGDNAGTADVAGTIRDSDRFNLNKFSLENIQVRTGSNKRADPDMWLSASYVRSGIISADATAKTRGFTVDDLKTVANRKFIKFTVPLQGGFDGVNIFDKDKRELSNNAAKREIDDSAQGGTAGPTVAAYRKAVDIMGSTSDVDIQLLAIPGIRHASVTDYAIDALESRFDSMLIMDIEERDEFNTVITSSVQNPHVGNTTTAFKNRALDSSFAAAYFPNVTVQDPDTGGLVSVPPSSVVLGAYSLNDRVGHPWFAPAGFSRGALRVVESTNVRLNRANLDDLYSADINPLAKYTGKPLSVWGQKTLLADPSALDRVNVRRLLIDVRRKVRAVANTLLFEPNRTETLEKFTSLVNPILQSVQDAQGVDRFKVIIDATTTSQADVENNTIRGKIFLQPTRSIEFIALDFVVTNAGTTL